MLRESIAHRALMLPISFPDHPVIDLGCCRNGWVMCFPAPLVSDDQPFLPRPPIKPQNDFLIKLLIHFCGEMSQRASCHDSGRVPRHYRGCIIKNYHRCYKLHLKNPFSFSLILFIKNYVFQAVPPCTQYLEGLCLYFVVVFLSLFVSSATSVTNLSNYFFQ